MEDRVGTAGVLSRNASAEIPAQWAGCPSERRVAVTVKVTSLSTATGVDVQESWYLQSSSYPVAFQSVGP